MIETHLETTPIITVITCPRLLGTLPVRGSAASESAPDSNHPRIIFQKQNIKINRFW